MKSKQFKIAGIFTVLIYLLLICLYCFHQGTKSHLDALQADFFARQLIDIKYDSVRNDMLISERTAIKIADQLISEKYGYWRTFLWKPFDTWLIDGHWLIYGPASKSNSGNGPIIIINNSTGETRIKL